MLKIHAACEKFSQFLALSCYFLVGMLYIKHKGQRLSTKKKKRVVKERVKVFEGLLNKQDERLFGRSTEKLGLQRKQENNY